LVDGHDAAEEVVGLDVLAAVLGEEAGDALLGGVVIEGVEDVAVGGGVAAEEEAEEGDDEAEVGEVEGAPEGVGGFAEVEDEEAAAGLEDAKEFGEAGFEVGEVAEAVGDGDEGEGVVVEGEAQGIGAAELGSGRGGAVGWVVGWGVLRSLGEHFGAEIAAGHGGSGAGEAEGDVAGAAADIEGGFGGADGGEADEAVFPEAVEAEGLEVVDEVVAGSDAGEEALDLGGALGAGLVVGGGHGAAIFTLARSAAVCGAPAAARSVGKPTGLGEKPSDLADVLRLAEGSHWFTGVAAAGLRHSRAPQKENGRGRGRRQKISGRGVSRIVKRFGVRGAHFCLCKPLSGGRLLRYMERV